MSYPGKGAIVFDSEQIETKKNSANLCGIPLEQLAIEHAGNKRYFNTVALGAVIGILKGDFKRLDDFLKRFFSSKSDVADANSSAAKAGFDYVRKNYPKLSLPLPLSQTPTKKMFINGNEAIALGAAGCRLPIFCRIPHESRNLNLNLPCWKGRRMQHDCRTG